MGNEYAEAIGVWEHTIGKITHKLVPKKEDNLEFLRVKKIATQNNDDSLIYTGLMDLYFKMVLRENPTMTEEEQKGLREWIGVNIADIATDLAIKFKWASQEQLDKLMEESVKKK